MNNEMVILVDEYDREIGTCPKLDAHLQGKLHRAFSLIIFNDKHEMLIHKRAKGKYHSGGLWTNACCSHPRPGEEMNKAVIRRCKEELGLDIVIPVFKGKFLYKVEFENGLTEHEMDYVYEVESMDIPVPDQDEIKACRFVPMEELKSDLMKNPHQYTFWFREIINKFYS
jgi:isopentenyl-diphosphate delta-isomerase